MATRLLVHLPSGPASFPLQNRAVILGSGPDCDIRLRHPTISKSHARLQSADDGQVLVEDLRSSNGTFADGRKLFEPTRVSFDCRLSFGGVHAELEDIPDGDAASAFMLDEPLPAQGALGSTAPSRSLGGATLATDVLGRFSLQALPEILSAVGDGLAPQIVAERLGAALMTHLPIDGVRILDLKSIDEVPCFQAGDCTDSTSHEVDEQEGSFSIRMSLRSKQAARTVQAPARLGLQLLTLADRRSPVVERKRIDEAPAVPDPPSLDPQVQRIYERASRIAGRNVNILILGESGTGKEVLSRYLHRAAGDEDAPFIALNCAALPKDLLEAELFGIEKGVATGVQARAGKFEAAHGGTLFLDEVGDMALETQAKILRVLQERTVYRLGGSNPHPFDIQVISATNRHLKTMIEAGTFRADLYYRLAGWEISLPALRERRVDIPNLAVHFFKQQARALGLCRVGMSVSALEAIKEYTWPGNIRQLHHEIARCMLMLSDGELLTSRHLGPDLRAAPPAPKKLEEALEDAERRCIAAALEQSDAPLEEIAQQLGISRTTLFRRMRDLGLERAST